MDKKFEWPTREEWEVRQRTVYYDLLEDLISTCLSDYASADEVAAAIAALRKLWCAYGRQMQEAKREAERSIGVTLNRDYYIYRYYKSSEEERKLVNAVLICQDQRKRINQVIKFLREGQYHYYINWVLERTDCPSRAIIKERYDAAWTAAELKVRQRVAVTPIDDAAWEKELQQRRRIDAYFNDPTANIHRSNVKEKAE
jgi:hypothetical protein